MSGPIRERLSGQLEWALGWAPWSLANAGPALQSREQSTFSAFNPGPQCEEASVYLISQGNV